MKTSLLSGAYKGGVDCKAEADSLKQQTKAMQKDDEQGRLPTQVLSDLYDDILDLQTGEKGQERLDIGDGNEAFLDWAMYYNYEGTCVTEDDRSPTEQLDVAFARVLDERRELEKAILPKPRIRNLSLPNFLVCSMSD